MAATRTMARSGIRTQILARTRDAVINPSLQQREFTDAQVDAAINESLLLLAPLGVTKFITLTYNDLMVAAIQPVFDIFSIRQVDLYGDPHGVIPLPPPTWRFNPDPINGRWLTLIHALDPAHSLVVTVISPYPLTYEDASLISADPETVTEYALALLYEQAGRHGETSDREALAQSAMAHRILGDQRKQAEMMRQYPEMVPQKGK